MKPSRTRRQLAVLLALVCATVQLALGSTLSTTALTLGFYANHPHGLGHAVTLQADGSHVDLVLSHDARPAHDHDAAPPGHVHPLTVSEGDHVVHIVEAGATSSAPRRASVDLPAVLETRLALAVAVPRAWNLQPSLAPRAQSVEQLRTVVLRI